MNMIDTNVNQAVSLLTAVDSYKFTHFMSYPKDMTYLKSYMVARGGYLLQDAIKFYGFPYYIQLLNNWIVTNEQIEFAQEKAKAHGIPFNYEGWKRVVDVHDGRLPLLIKALKEGTIIPSNHVLATVESTDPELAWLTSWVEPLLLKVWYPTTIATKSLYVYNLLKKWHDISVDDPGAIDFAYHNFGDRGSSSVESSLIGAAAHLSVFKGTDNFIAVAAGCEGYSIPATEHSTMTSMGRDGEFQLIENYLEQFKGWPMVACVLDSYNIYEAVEYVTTHLKDRIESPEYPIFVIRPDSGSPVDVVGAILSKMEQNGVRSHLNSKGYKVFDKFRIIWGDGVTPITIEQIVKYVVKRGYAANNIAFGSGGDLMQNCTRDTLKFAFKACCAALGDGVKYPISKDPITDEGKKSLAGDLTLVRKIGSGWHDRYPNDQYPYRNVNLLIDKIDGSTEEEALEIVYDWRT